ncbi:MAG: RNA 2',3'-cyclic phosphodiesterase [Acidobacteriota bacterium]|nr:RNA 2',3'-cyclic phosphodiesterase [Acidobacteriota bacterium]
MVNQESLRVFCAVEIPAEVKKRIADHVAFLRPHASDDTARWERAEKLHVTMKFFGEIPRQRIEDLSRAVTRAADFVPPFNLAVRGTGVFPPRVAPRVLWLGVHDDSSGLEKLQAALEGECARVGFTREPRPFHPHLTIARLRSARGAREIAEAHTQNNFQGEEFAVTEVIVMRSELGQGGSKYTVLSRHRLGEGGKVKWGNGEMVKGGSGGIE